MDISGFLAVPQDAADILTRKDFHVPLTNPKGRSEGITRTLYILIFGTRHDSKINELSIYTYTHQGDRRDISEGYYEVPDLGLGGTSC